MVSAVSVGLASIVVEVDEAIVMLVCSLFTVEAENEAVLDVEVLQAALVVPVSGDWLDAGTNIASGPPGISYWDFGWSPGCRVEVLR